MNLDENSITTANPGISRINIVQSYKVVREVMANDFAQTFDLDQTDFNSYFIIKSRIQHDEPRLSRDNLFYLKHELGRVPVLILYLQTTENRLVSNKTRNIAGSNSTVSEDV